MLAVGKEGDSLPSFFWQNHLQFIDLECSPLGKGWPKWFVQETYKFYTTSLGAKRSCCNFNYGLLAPFYYKSYCGLRHYMKQNKNDSPSNKYKYILVQLQLHGYIWNCFLSVKLSSQFPPFVKPYQCTKSEKVFVANVFLTTFIKGFIFSRQSSSSLSVHAN